MPLFNLKTESEQYKTNISVAAASMATQMCL